MVIFILTLHPRFSLKRANSLALPCILPSSRHASGPDQVPSFTGQASNSVGLHTSIIGHVTKTMDRRPDRTLRTNENACRIT